MDQVRHTPKLVTGELAGTQDLYDFCGRTPSVQMVTSSVTHNILLLAKLPRFVSINSAVEIDLHGQSNGETIGPVQISGVGGSLDYVEAAALSDGGISIIALPSTTEDGKHSKIVPSLATGAMVTTPALLHRLYCDRIRRRPTQRQRPARPGRRPDRHCPPGFSRRPAKQALACAG